MSGVRFEQVRRSYGTVDAIADLDLALERDCVVVVCGPPRAGKSVMLRLLVGLERPSSGRILIDGVDVTTWPAAKRRIGYVPQSFALFPHMSVRDNIAYPLRQRGVAPSEIDARVGRISEPLRIGHLLAKRPDQLSGGEKQRAAIARGTLQDAKLFALDDPLVGLDFKLRESLMDDLKDMRESLEASFIYATSDPLEALTMGDHLVVIENGRLIEHDRAERVYTEPATARSAQLVGFPRCNIFQGTRDGSRCSSPLAPFALEAVGLGTGSVDIAVRPEHVVLATGPTNEAVGKVVLIENLGAESVIHLDVAGLRLTSVPPTDLVDHLAVGAYYPFRISPEHLMVFDHAAGHRLGRGAAWLHA